MCGGDIISNPITQLVSDAVATAIGQPELIPVINGGEELAGGGGIKNSLIDAGASFGAQELAPALTNATGLTDPSVASGNSLTDLLGQTTGAGSVAGPGTIGGDISNGVQDLSNFSPSSGLSSLFGGTAAPSSDLSSAYTGIQNAAASPDLAASAATPSAVAPISGVAPGGPGIGGGAGGSVGGGVDLGNIGEANGLPSSSGIGANTSLDSSGIDSLAATPQSGLPSQPFPNVIAPSVDTNLLDSFNPASGLQSPVPQNPGGISGLFSGGATNGIGQGIDTNIGGDIGGGISTSGMGALASGVPTTASGGNVGTIGNLFASGASGGASGGSNMLNSLLKGGLGYLFNQPNTAGANAINSATQQAQAGFTPYAAAGANAENTLSNLYGTNGTAAQTSAQQNFQNTPGYQFALNQGLNAVNASAAQGGNPLSGNTYEALNNYAQGTANSTYKNYVNQLQNMASGGLSATGASGTAGLTGASAIAQLDQNKANAANTAIGTALNGLFPSGINLQQLLSGGGGGSGGGGLLSLFGV